MNQIIKLKVDFYTCIKYSYMILYCIFVLKSRCSNKKMSLVLAIRKAKFYVIF